MVQSLRDLGFLGCVLGFISISTMVRADGPTAATSTRGDIAAKLEELALKHAESQGFEGTVMVAKDGNVLLRRGFGKADRENAIASIPEMAYSIGSNTKCFTAAAILKLEQQGKLSVEWPITKFFESVPEDKREITIHHLLSHSSGLGEYHDRPGEGGDFAEMSRDEAISRILSQKLRCKPGERAAYSNCGYTLLAVIIEKVSQKSWEAFLRDELFTPAGMTMTGFYGEKLWPDKLVAKGYGPNHKADDRPSNWPGVTWALKGAGGIVSTVDDMYKWHQALSGHSILNEASKSKSFKVHSKEEDGPFGEGYGWVVGKTPRNTTVIAHAGGNDFGFNATMRRYLDENAFIAVMGNTGIGKCGPMEDALARALFTAK